MQIQIRIQIQIQIHADADADADPDPDSDPDSDSDSDSDSDMYISISYLHPYPYPQKFTENQEKANPHFMSISISILHIHIYIGGWGGESNREIGFGSFRSVRACVRASEAVCARERESVLPTARVRELQIFSGAGVQCVVSLGDETGDIIIHIKTCSPKH